MIKIIPIFNIVIIIIISLIVITYIKMRKSVFQMKHETNETENEELSVSNET